jgi:hypothetical protein
VHADALEQLIDGGFGRYISRPENLNRVLEFVREHEDRRVTLFDAHQQSEHPVGAGNGHRVGQRAVQYPVRAEIHGRPGLNEDDPVQGANPLDFLSEGSGPLQTGCNCCRQATVERAKLRRHGASSGAPFQRWVRLRARRSPARGNDDSNGHSDDCHPRGCASHGPSLSRTCADRGRNRSFRGRVSGVRS